MTSEEILEVLADQCEELREFAGASFEVLDTYWTIADTRLSAFSSDKIWGVAIEVVGFHYSAGTYSLNACLYGNCIKERENFYGQDFERELLTIPTDWMKQIKQNQWRHLKDGLGISRDGFAFRWRGRRFDFAPSLEDLRAVGIELSRREIESGELLPEQMLRFACEKLNHPFFLSEDALRDLLDRNAIPFEWKYDKENERSWYEKELGEFKQRPVLSIDLELVLQTRDWIHPKVGSADIDLGEWEISPREAFVTLAQTLATRDLAVWNAQDTSKFNSHWSHWSENDAEKERAEDKEIAVGKAEFYAVFESVPREQRAALLEAIRPSVARSLRRFHDYHKFVQWKEWKVPIFYELGDDLDAIEAQLKLEQPDA